MPFERVSFRSSDGTRLAGWFIPAAKSPRGVVILCHGVDSSMEAMLWKAKRLNERRLSALLFDFRGRGESDPALCTIGYRETDDLLAAVEYVRGRADCRRLPLGVFGESQGGAVALMAAARNPQVRAVAVESPYARLDRAVDNHFGSVFGTTGAVLARPVRWIGEALIRRRCQEISPLEAIGRIAPRPLLIVQDGADALCPPRETDAMMKQAGEPKELWTVPGSGHCRAEDVVPREFANRVASFFLESLKL